MIIQFEKINKEEFNKKQNEIVLLEEKSDDNFGKVHFNESVFVLGWRGDFILPVIKEIDSIRFGLGIDFNFLIVDSKKNKIIYSLKFDNYFINFIIFKKRIYVASELKVIELRIDSLEFLTEFYLPEIFDSFIITADSIKASCIDNQIINLSDSVTD